MTKPTAARQPAARTGKPHRSVVPALPSADSTNVAARIPLPARPLLALTASPHRPCLSEDPETSLATSLMLHLMSEHGVHDAVRMSEAEAARVHEELHRDGVCHHPVHDLRFRPIVAYKTLLDALDRHEAVQRLILGI